MKIEVKTDQDLIQWQKKNCQKCTWYKNGDDDYKNCKLAFDIDYAIFTGSLSLDTCKKIGATHIKGSSKVILNNKCNKLNTDKLKKK